MCTVTFTPRKRGYALAMNRDEQQSRVTGLPPSKQVIHGRAVLAPTEPGGGTWIALNDGGVTFALINWYSITARVKGEAISRGQVVIGTSAANTPDDAELALHELRLPKMNPFRLIGIFPNAQEIIQWQWDLRKLVRTKHHWQAQQWISSGFDEPTAQLTRGQAFREALKHKSAGSLNWLRCLHRSHSPEPGPFSTCMHRDDAVTVSYTEVSVASEIGKMRYHGGALCCHGNAHLQSFLLTSQ